MKQTTTPHSLNRALRRKQIIDHYGGCCTCCGEDHYEFLAIDHINGGGSGQRAQLRGLRLFDWLRTHNYPPGYRLLCRYCRHWTIGNSSGRCDSGHEHGLAPKKYARYEGS